MNFSQFWDCLSESCDWLAFLRSLVWHGRRHSLTSALIPFQDDRIKTSIHQSLVSVIVVSIARFPILNAWSNFDPSRYPGLSDWWIFRKASEQKVLHFCPRMCRFTESLTSNRAGHRVSEGTSSRLQLETRDVRVGWSILSPDSFRLRLADYVALDEMSLFRTLESWKNYKNTYHLFITTFLPQFLVTYRLKSSGDKPFYSLQAYVSSELLWPTLTKNVKVNYG